MEWLKRLHSRTAIIRPEDRFWPKWKRLLTVLLLWNIMWNTATWVFSEYIFTEIPYISYLQFVGKYGFWIIFPYFIVDAVAVERGWLAHKWRLYFIYSALGVLIAAIVFFFSITTFTLRLV